ncbi:MAG: 3-dehydroquinate synthase [Flavobacteriales bacterium]|jgi:3-dehydroquinate synthase
MKTLSIQQTFKVEYSYPVIFTDGIFCIENPILADLLKRDDGRQARALFVIDKNVADSNLTLHSHIKYYTLAHNIELASSPLIVQGGEAAKNDTQVFDQVYAKVAELAIDRHSYIIAIGGGAVIDAVGYAAATAHRGVRFIRVPTTVLAQNDAGIGVKNGVNHLDRKNFLGTFSPPRAVINDKRFLSTLSNRDKRSGIAEAIKVALIKDSEFFQYLFDNRMALSIFNSTEMQHMVFRCAELHLNHIRESGDPFELGSARPLDFGHWSAHKLEALSSYRIRHGEAVAVGMAMDVLYSFHKKMITDEQKNQFFDLIAVLGFELSVPELSMLDIGASLEEFREHLGGKLCITLLDGIGQSFETDSIDVDLMEYCRNSLISLSSTSHALGDV